MAEHVTFARLKVQPGKVDELMNLMSSNEPSLAPTGWTSSIAGRSKDDPNTVWVAVTWDTSDRYYANAESPQQNAQYEKMRAMLDSDPEWFDCDVLQETRA